MKDSIMKYSEAMGRWPSDYFPAARLGGWIINSRGDATPYHSRVYQFIANENIIFRQVLGVNWSYKRWSHILFRKHETKIHEARSAITKHGESASWRCEFSQILVIYGF